VCMPAQATTQVGTVGTFSAACARFAVIKFTNVLESSYSSLRGLWPTGLPGKPVAALYCTTSPPWLTFNVGYPQNGARANPAPRRPEVALARPCVQPRPVTAVHARLFSSLPEMEIWDLCSVGASSTGLRMTVFVGTNMFVKKDCTPNLKVATWYGRGRHENGKLLTAASCMSCFTLACHEC
jgi:hypothetical protein